MCPCVERFLYRYLSVVLPEPEVKVKLHKRHRGLSMVSPSLLAGLMSVLSIGWSCSLGGGGLWYGVTLVTCGFNVGAPSLPSFSLRQLLYGRSPCLGFTVESCWNAWARWATSPPFLGSQQQLLMKGASRCSTVTVTDTSQNWKQGARSYRNSVYHGH